MDHRCYCLFLALYTACSVAAADQGAPVYMAINTVPVVGGKCSGPRVQMETNSPTKVWCCSAGVWANCTPTPSSSGGVATSAPIQGDGSGGTPVSCRTATGSVSGCLTSTDWSTFNGRSGTGACAANQWASTLNAGAAPTCTQPTFSNVSGTVTDLQLANSYGGIGACSTGSAVVAMSRNSAPTCAQIPLNYIADPTARAGFTMGTYKLAFRYSTPAPEANYEGALSVYATGAYTSDLLHVEATGSPESNVNVALFKAATNHSLPLRLTSASSTDPSLIANGTITASQFVGPPYQEAWIAVGSMSGTWANFDSSETTYRKLQYRKDQAGRVWVIGMATGGTSGTPAFTLAPGYRPLKSMNFPAEANGTFGIVSITSAGLVALTGSTTTTAFALDGINFPTD